MDSELLRVTEENLAAESLCCIVRMKKTHPGIEAKQAWLAERIPEGHVLIRYNKLRKFQNRRIENSPQNKGQGQRHLVE